MVFLGAPIANIVDVSKLKIKVNIQENDIYKIKPNDAVIIKSDLFPETAYNGKIDNVSVKGDSTHNFPVEISMV